MNKILLEKIMEAFSSVLPVTIIVLIISMVLVPMPAGTLLLFLGGAALLIVGMGLFSLGADMAMMPMGEGIGIQLTQKSNLFIAIFMSFVMGVIITMAEPDLQVLAKLVPSIPPFYLIGTVALGVGFFLAISVARIFFRVPLYVLLIIFYIAIFVVVWLAPNTFIPVAFDSGGVTTGPITVPFILALGVGYAAMRSDKDSQNDSFGLVSLCSLGPILAVLFLGIFYKPTGVALESHKTFVPETSQEVVLAFAHEVPRFLYEVTLAIGALVLFFIFFQIRYRRYNRHQLARMAIGFVYTFVGLVVFLTGVDVGFIPVGQLLGSKLGASPYNWILIPLSMLIGYYLVNAEPAVHVLNKQVEDISSGAIPQRAMKRGLSIGMASALGINMIRILLGVPIIYILVPGYLFALVLTFFVPRIFTGIAFDSGGVCSGPMTSTFLLPLAMGTCEGVGGNLMTDAFGVVALVAMAPLIVIQFMGLMYGRKMKVTLKLAEEQFEAVRADDYGEIIEFEEADHDTGE